MTRSFIAAALLLSATAMPAPLHAQQGPAPKAPFAENVFGDAVSDPYRWMEDPARRGEMLAWLEASSSAARRPLDALPERAAFAALLAAATAAGTSQGEAQSAGNRLFFLRAEPSDQTPRLIVREGTDEHVLFVPPKGTAISNYSVAPDGRTVAVHVARGGGEAGDVTFIDVATGMPRGATLGPIWGQLPVAWLSNDRIAYTRMAGYSGEDLQRGMQVVVGQPGAADAGRAIFGQDVAGNVSGSEFPLLSRGAASDLVLVTAGGARPDVRALVALASALETPAVLKRPELFSALPPRVAILNPTRLAVADNGPNQFAEMGDPSIPAGYAALTAQDSYRMLESARDLPDTLLTVGLNDRRVSPWMSAKFAARALERFGDRRRVLVRADAEAGHGVGSARDGLIAEFTDLYAFAWDRVTSGGNPAR